MHEAVSYRLGSKREEEAGDATSGEDSEDKEGRATARRGEGGEGGGREEKERGGGVAAEGGAQIRKIKNKKRQADRHLEVGEAGVAGERAAKIRENGRRFAHFGEVVQLGSLGGG